jgi:hypothetical protein
MAIVDHTLFVTGAQRSGTTLLAKLLGAQSKVSMLSQPFPLLFTEVKREFLGVRDRYPLGHLFLESRYEHGDFARFLREWRTTPESLESLFHRMDDYSGQYTRFTARERRRVFSMLSPTDDFAAVVSHLDIAFATKDAAWVGSKETSCEEYVPPLLARGFRCAIILRDPRDVVASLNHGRGREFGGDPKPTLFNVRSWRKSVALALAAESQPGFARCRYEDLVADPARELGRLAESLGLGASDVPQEIRDENGDLWRGNSSHIEHEGISTASVGMYRRLMAPAVAEFVEAACLPEMHFLGYETSLTREAAARVLERFVEPESTPRPGMERDAITRANKRLEAQRLERVTAPPDDDSRQWFLFAEAHAKLRAGFQP